MSKGIHPSFLPGGLPDVLPPLSRTTARRPPWLSSEGSSGNLPVSSLPSQQPPPQTHRQTGIDPLQEMINEAGYTSECHRETSPPGSLM